MRKLREELQKYPALAYVGLILSLEHLLTILFWLTERPLYWILSESNPSICWPFFSACETFKPTPGGLNLILGVYLLIVGLAAVSWLLRYHRLGIIFLWTLLAIKTSLLFLDYRLTGNYHYIPAMLTLVFLLVPRRPWALAMAFFILYITAGLLKVNGQWLDGSAIRDSVMPTIMTKLGVWYALFLELGLIYLLFAKKDRWFYFLFFQLVYFHLYSWHITRFFYPSVMLLLLGILLIIRPMISEWNLKTAFKMAFESKESRILLGFFVLLQAPQYLISGDSSLTGEGRMYAMIMYDGRVQCQPHLTIWKKDHTKETLPLHPPWMMTRTQCDPIVYLRLAEKTCQWIKKDPTVLQLDLSIPVRFDNTTDWQPLVSATDVCKNEIYYSSFFPNPWINKISSDYFQKNKDYNETGGAED